MHWHYGRALLSTLVSNKSIAILNTRIHMHDANMGGERDLRGDGEGGLVKTVKSKCYFMIERL